MHMHSGSSARRQADGGTQWSSGTDRVQSSITMTSAIVCSCSQAAGWPAQAARAGPRAVALPAAWSPRQHHQTARYNRKQRQTARAGAPLATGVVEPGL